MYVHKLERKLWDLKHSEADERPMHKPKILCGPKVDSIEFFQEKVDKYNARCVPVLVSVARWLTTLSLRFNG